MQPLTSMYLDAIRVAATLGVFATHAGHGFFSSGQSWLMPVGHSMVVLFFVISGYVIAHSTRHGKDGRQYCMARLSRLYSVALPALALTALCDMIGRSINPAAYELAARMDGYWMRIAVNIPFLGQSGTLCSSPGSNTPFWSLNYEFWYYVLFGAFTFAPTRKWRLIGCTIAAVAAGWKILLLLPAWLLGVLAYRLSERSWMNPGRALMLFIISGVTLLSVVLNVLPVPFMSPEIDAGAPLYFSTAFAGDYQLALLFALHLVAFNDMTRRHNGEPFPKLHRAIRGAADRTFSLYAYHMPLLVLIGATIPYQKNSAWHVILMMALTLALVILLAGLTEQRRTALRRWMNELLSRFSPAPAEHHRPGSN